jgi:hypothetical protein
MLLLRREEQWKVAQEIEAMMPFSDSEDNNEGKVNGIQQLCYFREISRLLEDYSIIV